MHLLFRLIILFIPVFMGFIAVWDSAIQSGKAFSLLDTHTQFLANRPLNIDQITKFLDIKKLTDKVTAAEPPEKKILVDLNAQKLYAYANGTKIFEFLISSGKWAPTPTGEFRIWTKLRYDDMQGGNKEIGTYYFLPKVPYVMYFENDRVPKWKGYSIHGTYWHNNFGHPMSHGCINMKNEEVAQLYQWANPSGGRDKSVNATDENPGTVIMIYGTAPES